MTSAPFFPKSTRRQALGAAGAAAAGLMLPLAARPAAARAATPGSYTWRKGGQSNGGYCNAIARDPNNPGSVVACGDVWAFAASQDFGANWYPTNLGQAPAQPYGRCAVFSKLNPGRCYVGVGTLKYQSPTGGGYLGVIDPAITGSQYGLAKQNSNVSFTSYLPTGGAGDLPRPVGNLMAVDYDSSSGIEYLYCLTRQGLMRSTDGGVTMTPLGLNAPAPLYAWSAIAVLTDTGGSLLVSSFRTSDTGGSILWKVTNPRTASPTVTQLSGPPVIEDILIARGSNISANLLVCGGGGLQSQNGTFYMHVGSGVHLSTAAQGPDGTVYVGNGVGSDINHLVASTKDGGNSWQWRTPPSSVSPTIYGTSRPYWLANVWSAMSIGTGFSVSQLVVDGSTIYIAGRQGVHASHDSGNTWAPTCNGLDGSESNSFASSGSDIWASDTDYTSSHSTDGFVNADQDAHPPAFQTPALSRTDGGGNTYSVNGVQILVNGVDMADDFARSALVNPKDLLVDANGRIYVALSGGVLVGDPA